jgi:hypothetical protein
MLILFGPSQSLCCFRWAKNHNTGSCTDMAAPVRTIQLNSQAVNDRLTNQGFQQLDGCWMSSTRWARITPLLRGRVSVTIGVAT